MNGQKGNTMYKYYLFDLDGTISQSEPGILNCIRYALDAAGLPEPSEKVLKTFIGPSLYDSFTSKCHVDHDQALWLVAKYRERYNVTGLYETSIYGGIPETLKALKERGAKIGVATSKPTAPTEKILEKFDLAKYFDVVVGSNPDGTGSDKQVLIAECLKRLKEADAEGTDMPQADREEAVMMDDSKPEVKTQIHEKDAVMIGDRMFDIDRGHACGIDTVGVLYGYGNREEFEKAGAEYIISRPEELLTL